MVAFAEEEEEEEEVSVNRVSRHQRSEYFSGYKFN